jgi:predicted nucleic acid-binding protein
MTYILDACALLALLNWELGKGYETVRDLLESAAKGEAVLCMSLINLVEVYYRYIQLKGVELADNVMEEVKSLPSFLPMLSSAPQLKALLPLLLPRIKKLNPPKKLSLCLYSGYNPHGFLLIPYFPR